LGSSSLALRFLLWGRSSGSNPLLSSTSPCFPAPSSPSSSFLPFPFPSSSSLPKEIPSLLSLSQRSQPIGPGGSWSISSVCVCGRTRLRNKKKTCTPKPKNPLGA
ncbi:unnamed protein product, partial [Ectocarpus sp. 13 AM-2016]